MALATSTIATIGALSSVAAVGVSAASAMSSNRNAREAQGAQREAADRQADIADRQQAIADKQWANYEEIYAPMERQRAEEVKGIGSIANQEQAAKGAAADVLGAFGGIRERLTKTPGINPNSQAYLQELSKIGLAESAASSAAQTAARERKVALGEAAKTDVLNYGKGIASNAAGALAGAAGTYGSIAGQYGNIAAQQSAGAASTAGGVGRFLGGLNGSGAFSTIGDWLKPSSGYDVGGANDPRWATGSYGADPSGFINDFNP